MHLGSRRASRDHAHYLKYRDYYLQKSRERHVVKKVEIGIYKRAAKYGLSKAQVKEYLSNPCSICREPSKAIDHCHETGQVRGALCNSCNKGLGFFKESSQRLHAAINYLEGRNALHQAN
jgi:hypothetical protein